MIRVLREALGLLFVFATLWFGLSRIPWTGLLSFGAARDATEEKVGELVWSYVRQTNRIVRDPVVTAPVEALVTHLCAAAELERCPVAAYVVRSDEVNAYALPGRRLIVTTAMLREVHDESELAGVLGHELAHVERRHSMQVLAREIGLTLLLTAGGGQSTVLRDAAKALTTSAYDRSLESEADFDAVEHLAAGRIASLPFAELMYRLAESEGDFASSLTWLSSHPDPYQRAKAITEASAAHRYTPVAVLDPAAWRELQDALRTTED